MVTRETIFLFISTEMLLIIILYVATTIFVLE